MLRRLVSFVLFDFPALFVGKILWQNINNINDPSKTENTVCKEINNSRCCFANIKSVEPEKSEHQCQKQRYCPRFVTFYRVIRRIRILKGGRRSFPDRLWWRRIVVIIDNHILRLFITVVYFGTAVRAKSVFASYFRATIFTFHYCYTTLLSLFYLLKIV